MLDNIAFKYGLGSAGIWILTKLLVFFLGYSIDWIDGILMFNNFMLILVIALAIFNTKRKVNFVDVPKREDIKIGIKTGMIYTILVSTFTYFYNSNIDTSVLNSKITQRLEQFDMALSQEQGIKRYKESNPQSLSLTKEQILVKEREATVNFLNPRVSTLLLLMFFTLLSVFYSAFITLVIRKIYMPGVQSRR